MDTTELLMDICGLEIAGFVGKGKGARTIWRIPGTLPDYVFYDEVLRLGEAHHTHFEPVGPDRHTQSAADRQFAKMNSRRAGFEKLPPQRRRKGQ